MLSHLLQTTCQLSREWATEGGDWGEKETCAQKCDHCGATSLYEWKVERSHRKSWVWEIKLLTGAWTMHAHLHKLNKIFRNRFGNALQIVNTVLRWVKTFIVVGWIGSVCVAAGRTRDGDKLERWRKFWTKTWAEQIGSVQTHSFDIQDDKTEVLNKNSTHHSFVPVWRSAVWPTHLNEKPPKFRSH